MSEPSKKGPLLAVFGLLALIVVYSCMFAIDEREVAVVQQFGKVVESIKDPGLYFKIPLIQDVRRLPKTNQFWANARNDVLVDLPTRDGKKVEVSIWAIWRITDAQQFVQVMQTTDNAQAQVSQRVRAAVRDTISQYDLAEVVRSSDREMDYSFGLEEVPDITPDADLDEEPTIVPIGGKISIKVGREKIIDQIRLLVQKQIDGDAEVEGSLDRGIEIIDVGISNIGFADSVRRAAFERLQAFMESIAARYKNAGEQRKQEIINQTKSEAEKILGEGEEQSKRIRGEVEAEIIESYANAIRETGDFYRFQRMLEVYKKSLGADTRLILTTDSELFRMLKRIETEATPRNE